MNQHNRKVREVVIPIGPSIAYVELTHGLYAVIDSWRAEEVGKYNWHAARGMKDGPFYAQMKPSSGKVFLHRFLLEAGNLQVDHRNMDTLFNIQANLRESTNAQNNRNKKIRSDSRNPYKGIGRSKSGKRWDSTIKVDGKKIWIGSFEDPKDAHMAYAEAAAKLHGEYARSI